MARTKEEIESDFKAGKITMEQAVEEVSKLNKKPPQFKVAEKSGWLSIYFSGLRFPCSMPAKCAEDLFTAENVERAKRFLADNAKSFKHKE